MDQILAILLAFPLKEPRPSVNLIALPSDRSARGHTNRTISYRRRPVHTHDHTSANMLGLALWAQIIGFVIFFFFFT